MSKHSEVPVLDENQIIAERRTKLNAWREKGIAFPNKFMRANIASELHEKYEDLDRDTMDLNPVVVKVAGRMMFKRLHGKSSFASIQDMSGSIQIYLTDSYPGKEQHEEFKHFGMDLEFLLRRTPKWRVVLKDILFKKGDIVEHGEEAEDDVDD